MHQTIKKISLLLVLSTSCIFAGCSGSGGSAGSGVAAADTVSINGTTYAENGTTLKIDGYLLQASPYAYKYGGPLAVITMRDTTSGNSSDFSVLSTASGWPGVYNLVAGGTETTARITDKSVTTGGLMVDSANGTLTGGSITVDALGGVGQLITGSFNMNLCDSNTTCSASVKNYTGMYSISRSANVGSLARPVSVSPAITITYGIHPTTGKNYYTIPTNPTGGTLTLTLTPTVDVNMAVFTDPGFTTPVTCNVTSTLNVVGTSVETCAITVTASQKLYVTVSQTTTATGFETYTLKVAE